MRTSLLVLVSLVSLVIAVAACPAPEASPDADLASVDLRATDDLLPAVVVSTVAGEVWSAPCEGVAGVGVRVVGTSVDVVSDDTGHFSLDQVPSGAPFELSRDGYAPTLTFARTEPASSTLLVPLVANEIVAAAYVLAGATLASGNGTVALALGDERRLPAGGVTVSLRPEDGSAPRTARYPTPAAVGLGFDGVATDPQLGAAVFFDVPAGRYQLQIVGSALPFPATTVIVEAGYVSADVLLAPVVSDAAPLTFSGWVTSAATLAEPSQPAAPVEGATVTLTGEGGAVTATTAANGAWTLVAPRAFLRIDLSAQHDGYLVARSSEECLTPLSHFVRGLGLLQAHAAYNAMTTAYAGKPPAPATGAIRALIPVDKDLGIPPDVTVTIDPPVVAVDYGASNLAWPDSCVVQSSCSDSVPCPSGARCEGGECLQGDGPSCARCGADYACPVGTIEQFVGPGEQCFCVAEVASCLLASCAAGNVCWMRHSYANEPSGMHSVCVPWRQKLPTAAGAVASFVDVPPGRYTLRASTPASGYFFLPVVVRIEAGVFAEPVLFWGTH